MFKEETTIKQIGKSKKELWRDFKKLVFGMLIQVIVFGCGTALFLYIEHCYDIVPKPLSTMEESYVEICARAMKREHQNQYNTNSTTTYNNTSTTPTPTLASPSTPANTTHNAVNVTSFNNIDNRSFHEYVALICKQNGELREIRKCEITHKSVTKWFDYTQTISYTIGYGYVVTYSDTGKIATILYTIPAIAVSMNCLTIAANMLTNISKILITSFEVKVLKKEVIRTLCVKVFVLQIFGALCLWLLSTTIVVLNDELSVLDSGYFNLMSLTTVGFGDFYFSTEKYIGNPAMFLVANAQFFFGLAVMASVINGFSQMITVRKKKTKSKDAQPKEQAKDEVNS